MRRLGALLGTLLLVAGCLFDASVPDGTVVICTTDEECPIGLRCQGASGRCIPEGSETTPPGIVDVEVSASALAHGDETTIVFTTTEPLLRVPEVFLNHPEGATPLEGEALDDERTQFSFRYRADRDLIQEGAHVVSGHLIDRVGNASGGLTLAIIRFDDTAPTLLEEGTRIDPSVVRPGASVGVIVSADEPVAYGIFLEVEEGGVRTSHEPVTLAGSIATFLVDVAPDAQAGQRTLTVGGLEDLAGNRSPEEVSVGTITVDASPPVLMNVVVAQPRASAVAPFNTLAVEFDVDAVTELTAEVGGRPMSCNAPTGHVVCTYAVTTLDPEGPTELVVKALDSVGNLSTEVFLVTVDHSPPTVLDEELGLTAGAGNPLLAPSVAKTGTMVDVTLQLDEALGEPPLLAAPAIGLSFQATAADLAGEQTFVATLGAESSGSIDLVATLTDDVGNQGQGILTTRLVVDNDAPAAPDVDMLDGLVLTRIPWGAASTDGAPRTALAGAPGVISDGIRLRALSADGEELGRTPIGLDGSVPTLELGAVDRAEVFVESIDEAGNTSPRVRVREAIWVATLAGREPGTDSLNPHELRASDEFEPSLDALLTAPELSGDDVATRADGAVLTMAGELAWSPIRASADAPVSAAAMAYDWASGIALNTRSPVGVLENWLWDGFSWTFFIPSDPEGDGGPSARSGHRMAYHDGYASILLFGGQSGGQHLHDLWRFDARGKSWEHLDDGSGPSPRHNPAVVYDVARSELLVFGGSDGGGRLADTWVWRIDDASWTNMGDAGPSARDSAAVGYDVVRERVVLFGGRNNQGDLADTWEWNGDLWEERIVVDEGGDGEPYASSAAAIAFDPDGAGVVMRGGSSNDPRVWTWDGDQWRNEVAVNAADVEAGGLLPGGTVLMTDSPDGFLMLGNDVTVGFNLAGKLFTRTKGGLENISRIDHALAFVDDGVDSHALLFGGYGALGTDTSLYYSQAGDPGVTYRWDREVWATADDGSGAAPSWRSSHAITAIPNTDAALLFGGWLDYDTTVVPPVAVLSDETWRWDGSSWTDMNPAERPSPRMKHLMVFDEEAGRVLLYGGVDPSGQILTDTWEWTDTTWNELDTAGPERTAADMVWHASCDCAVLYGGRDAALVRSSDTYTFDRDRTPPWLPVDGVLNPAARSDHRMVYDPTRDVTVMVGGLVGQTGAGNPVDETWEWNGTGWTRVAASTLGGGTLAGDLGRHTLEFDPELGEPLVFGGYTRLDMLNLTGAGRRPALSARFSVDALGVDGATIDRLLVSADAGGLGFADDEVAEGAELLVWRRPGGWERAAANTTSVSRPTTMSAELSKPSLAVFNGHIHVAVAPVATSATTTGQAEVSMDYVEIQLEYTLPPG